MVTPPQILLTGPSGSGKTTIMEELIKEFPGKFKKPIQYTTRKPRSDKELDDYVFLTKPQFYKKLENGDFVEFTEYNGELYAICRYFDTNISNIFIVEPVGRACLKKYFHINGIKYRGIYLDITEGMALSRLMRRGDTKLTIDKRLEDFKYFHPEVDDKVLDASLPIERNVDFIAKSSGAL